ncbi:MAG: siphovirus Gp157 family protein [Bacteroidales bacterium]|nr:siphovirus Gp157 family protein [Candidatus Scybalousia scybalohippi]
MYKLHEIPEAIEILSNMMCDPETGEILTEEQTNEQLAALEMEFDKKMEYLCKLAINEGAEAEMLKKHKLEIEKRQKAAENKVKRLKSYIKNALQNNKFKSADGLVSVSYRTTKDTVKIDDLAVIPLDYFKMQYTESNISKTAIKDAIKAGETIPGAHLEDSVSVIIK